MLKEKKIIILVGDGMADEPLAELGNRTPLAAAATPNMDRIARTGILGLTRTVPPGMPPGSDTANLSIFGYDPTRYYSGRAPLEALNLGIDLGPRDVAFRCNMVTIGNNAMESFTAGHIETDFSRIVLEELAARLTIPGIELHTGVSYRNSLIWRDFPHGEVPATVPPHDIQDLEITPYLPAGEGAATLLAIMDLAREVMASSPAIGKARERLKGKPNGVWLWGGGRRPAMETLEARFGLRGHTISAVDLIHGIGRAAGLTPLDVPGATGYIDTNYSGKAEALLAGVRESNFMFLHVESPDESGHEGNLDHKLQAIEDFDRLVVGPVLEGLAAYDDFVLLVMPDHPTPIRLRTHTADPIPFAACGSRGWAGPEFASFAGDSFDEAAALRTGLFITEAHRILELMLRGKLS